MVISAAAVVIGLYLIATTRPTPDSWYPKCFHYRLSGLHCPGCGTGRALHFALNGHLLEAARYNIYAVVALPILTVIILRASVAWALARENRSQRFLGARWIWLLLVFILLFWVGRNIPVVPFTYLAPHELEPSASAPQP